MKILVIDDHPMFIEGMGYLLKQSSKGVEIHKANSAENALTILKQGIDFDLALLDINMPGMDGISLLQRIHAEAFSLPVVIVSSDERIGLIHQAMEIGAMGFIPKSFEPEAMRQAIALVLEGEPFLPDNIKVLLARLPQRQQQNSCVTPARESGISNKQFEVLALLAKGYSNEQIANTLCRTEHTVKSHISALFQLLGASNRNECVRIAQQRGLLAEI